MYVCMDLYMCVWMCICMYVMFVCTQSDNYIMRLRLQNKTGTKDLSTICILFKVHPFCIDTASGTI